MASKILIDATHHHEVRVAIVEGQQLLHYDYDSLENHHKKGCIYKGVISRIEPSLNAAFIDYGAQRHGFLPASEVSPLLYPKSLGHQDRPTIQEILTKGQELIVQIDKDEIGNKGAALTTNISIAGCYIVLMPVTSNAGGISRQIDGEDREQLMRLINQMDIPENYSIIVRTASIGRSLDELLWDFNVLKSQWEALNLCAQESKEPVLLYQEGAILSRVIRDYLKPSIEEILIDDKSVYEEVLKLVQHIRPDFLSMVKLFDTKKTSLFSFYGIEPLIESLFNSYVVLENGATLVIDHREALTSIDINSARSTTGSNIETTAFQTNLAAAKEIARQICLRNIGGQIVIDFIDMSSADDCRQVEKVLQDALSHDRARHQFCKISRLGLLQMSRQRIKTSLDAQQLTTCANCHGQGKHRRPRPVALSILRLIEQESHRHPGRLFEIAAHPQIAEYLFNEYRLDLCRIEKQSGTLIKLKTITAAGSGDYVINVLDGPKVVKKITNTPFAEQAEIEHSTYLEQVATAKSQQMGMIPDSPPNPRGISWLQRLWSMFTPAGEQKAEIAAPEAPASRSDKPRRRRNSNNNGDGRNRRPRNDQQECRKERQERPERQQSEGQPQSESRRRQPQSAEQPLRKQEPRNRKPRNSKPTMEEEVLPQSPSKSMPAKRAHRSLTRPEALVSNIAPSVEAAPVAPPPAPLVKPVKTAQPDTVTTETASEQQPRQPRSSHGRRRRPRSYNNQPKPTAPEAPSE